MSSITIPSAARIITPPISQSQEAAPSGVMSGSASLAASGIAAPIVAAASSPTQLPPAAVPSDNSSSSPAIRTISPKDIEKTLEFEERLAEDMELQLECIKTLQDMGSSIAHKSMDQYIKKCEYFSQLQANRIALEKLSGISPSCLKSRVPSPKDIEVVMIESLEKQLNFLAKRIDKPSPLTQDDMRQYEKDAAYLDKIQTERVAALGAYPKIFDWQFSFKSPASSAAAPISVVSDSQEERMDQLSAMHAAALPYMTSSQFDEFLNQAHKD